jgi:hypothetical protein
MRLEVIDYIVPEEPHHQDTLPRRHFKQTKRAPPRLQVYERVALGEAESMACGMRGRRDAAVRGPRIAIRITPSRRLLVVRYDKTIGATGSEFGTDANDGSSTRH